MSKRGQVAAVCISPNFNVPKYYQDWVMVGQYGFIGDIHSGSTRISRRTGQPKFNDRQVSICAQEVYKELNEELGLTLASGDFGENITTLGLGDLSDVTPGAWLIIPNKSIAFEVTEQNDPCVNLQKYHKLIVRKTYGRRGLLAIVRMGAGLLLFPGEPIQIIS